MRGKKKEVDREEDRRYLLTIPNKDIRRFAMLCNLSRLDESKIAAIKDAERKIGRTILAYNCFDASPADLTKDQLAQIQGIEKKLGLVLVAVK